jgi:hypothetical protein
MVPGCHLAMDPLRVQWERERSEETTSEAV